MQISLKLIQAINHAKSTVCTKFQLLVTFTSLFTASSVLQAFPRLLLYVQGMVKKDIKLKAVGQSVLKTRDGSITLVRWVGRSDGA